MSKSLKILYVCKSMPWQYKGGIQTHTVDLATEMANNGHIVSILTAGQHFFRTSSSIVGGVQYIQLGYLPGRHVPVLWIFLEELFFNLSVLFWLLKHSGRFDVIHLQGRSGMFVPFFIRHSGIFITCHGLLKREMESAGRNASFSQTIHYRCTLPLERSYYRTSRLIAVSESLKADLRQLYKVASPIQVVTNGVYLPTLLCKHHPSAKALFIGRIEHGKGIFDLLDAMPWITADIQLVILGSGTQDHRLSMRIQSDGMLKSRVQYLGAVDRATVCRELSSAFTLVLPSYAETQGIVLLEANALAIPVVATQIPGINEVVQHERNGLLVPVSDPYSIAQAVNRLHANPTEAKTMGMTGREMVEQKYSWQVVAQKFHSHYTNALA